MVADRVTRETPWHLVLVLDDSGSMAGEGATAVNRGLDGFNEELVSFNKGTMDRIFISAIKFGTDASLLLEHQAETKVDMSKLTGFTGSSGGTNMAAALRLAADVIKRNPGKASDFIPYVLVFTDGAPNTPTAVEEWVAAANDIKAIRGPDGEAPRIAAIGCGAEVNRDVLDRIATSPEISIVLENFSELQMFFTQVGTATGSARGAAGMDRAIASSGNMD
jgi:uncharacterized protein YegL